jgi:molybdopterin-binding protein
MKLSTRNEFVGTITRLVRGPVSTEVIIRIADGVEIVSVITTNSAKRLKLKKWAACARVHKGRPHYRRC